ncbi:hypothetical protein ACN9MB_07360 [Dyella kyungheensis]|jgi:hypothetical protein|uniref:hypothetical protein n=1 Tax=Dyella kyungheensis TaxID=1242174 RepID=UPI003CF8C218
MKNSGKGDIELIDDNLDHGVWADNESPTQSMSVVKPGEKKFFRAEQGGDIPLIGSFATGTEGWALFRTKIPDPEMGGSMDCYVKISWNLPYVAFSSDGVGAWVNAYRYDPREVIGDGAFDTRDKRPPPIELQQGGGSEDTGGDRFVFLIPQAYPWMLTFYPMVIAESDTFIEATFSINNTVAPESTTLPPPPFTDTKSVKPVPQPLTGSKPESWFGTWRSEHVVVRIFDAGGGLLNVQVTEAAFGQTLERPVQQVGISRLIFKANVAAVTDTAFTSRPSGSSALSRLKVEEHDLVGSRQAKINPIERTSPVFLKILKSNPEIVAAIVEDKHQIGGDYLRLAPDAVLEIYKMVAGGSVVDITLRYRRPGTQGVLTVSRIDEVLTYELRVG